MPFLPPNQQCQSTGGNHIWPVTINITGRTIQHTHPFNSPLSGTTQVSQYQKGKNNLDFTEARETVSGSGISWTIFKSAPRSRQITIQHTHTRLTALCPGLPGSASTRKVKTIWILLIQQPVSGSGISWAICKSAPRSRQITVPGLHYLSF